MTQRTERRKPWRREIILVAALTITIAVAGWVKVGTVIDSIQTNREQILRENCEDTNARNRNTIAALNDVLDHYAKQHPDKRAQIEQSRRSNILLINALVPVRDCDAVVDRLDTNG